mmetsp:Transcript_32494/g.107085  ORF Transcript_32494/g.107085 Transcript_32494/m.107085 type:complete len:295 (+) Transcript_32494:105-989(+)
MGSDIVEIDVGGVVFKTTVATLKKSPHLRKVLEYEDSRAFGQSSRDDHGRFFLDRNPDMFVQVLKYLRCGKWFVPDSADTAFLSELAAECEYLQIDDTSFLLMVSNLAGGSHGGHGNIDPLFAELRRVILSGHCGGGAITTSRSDSAQSHRCLESSRNLSRARTRDAVVSVAQDHQSTCVDPSVVFQRLNDCIRDSACSSRRCADTYLVGNVVSCMALAILAPEIRSLAEMTTFVESRMHRLSGTLDRAGGIDYAFYVCFKSSDLGGELAKDDCIFVVLEVGRLTISILGWRPE